MDTGTWIVFGFGVTMVLLFGAADSGALDAAWNLIRRLIK